MLALLYVARNYVYNLCLMIRQELKLQRLGPIAIKLILISVNVPFAELDSQTSTCYFEWCGGDNRFIEMISLLAAAS